jgi:hypothetical protein
MQMVAAAIRTRNLLAVPGSRNEALEGHAPANTVCRGIEKLCHPE